MTTNEHVKLTIPLEELIIEGRNIMHRIEEAGDSAAQDVLRPIIAIGKCPRLAVRYLLPGRQQV